MNKWTKHRSLNRDAPWWSIRESIYESVEWSVWCSVRESVNRTVWWSVNRSVLEARNE